MSELISPKDALEVVHFELGEARPSNYLLERYRDPKPAPGISAAAAWYMGLENSGKSNYLAKAVLNHFDSKSETAKPAAIYLALCTTVPTAEKTGSTIVEATYTGYARKKIEPAQMASATGASEGEAKNNEALAFAECTASSSTIIGWALCDALTVGNALWWGTCTSTVISTTQTPATVAKEALVLKEA